MLSPRHLKLLSCTEKLDPNNSVNDCKSCNTLVQTVHSMDEYDDSYKCHYYKTKKFSDGDFKLLSKKMDRVIMDSIPLREGDEIMTTGMMEPVNFNPQLCAECGCHIINDDECSYCSDCCSGCSIH